MPYKHLKDIPIQKVKEIARISRNYTDFIKKLGFADGGAQRTNLKLLVASNDIDCSHFTSRRDCLPTEEAKRRKKISHKKLGQRKKFERANNINTHMYLYEDMKRSDKKKGRPFNLTIEFIEKTIAAGCFYCENKTLRMTLDRINNAKGHTQNNVNPSCIRCNNIRGNMPYNAWLKLVPKIKEINNLGLFGGWVGGRRQTRVSPASPET